MLVKKRLFTVMIAIILISIGFLFGSTYGARTIKLFYNGNETPCNPPPQIIKGSTYVPLKFISNLFGISIAWDQTKYAVYLGYKPNTSYADLIEGLKPYKQSSCTFSIKTPITINGISYNRGYYKPYSPYADVVGCGLEIYWNLNKRYSKIEFSTGCPDNMGEVHPIEIFGDNTKLGITPKLNTIDGVKTYTYDVSDVNILHFHGLPNDDESYAPILNLKGWMRP